MKSRFDIERAVNLMLVQHGSAAALAATERANELTERGDVVGAEAWRLVLAAIEKVQRSPGRGGSVE